MIGDVEYLPVKIEDSLQLKASFERLAEDLLT